MLTPIELAEFAQSDVKEYFSFFEMPEGEQEIRIVSPVTAGWSYWAIVKDGEGREKSQRTVYRHDNHSDAVRYAPVGKSPKKAFFFCAHPSGTDRIQLVVMENSTLQKELAEIMIKHKDVTALTLIFRKHGTGPKAIFSVSPYKVKGAKGLEPLISEIPVETKKLMEAYPFDLENLFNQSKVFLT